MTAVGRTEPGRLANYLQLDIRGHRHVQHLDPTIRNQVPPVSMHRRNRMPPRHLASLRLASRRNRDRTKTRRPIRHQLAIGHDETGANTTDSHVPLRRQLDRGRSAQLMKQRKQLLERPAQQR